MNKTENARALMRRVNDWMILVLFFFIPFSRSATSLLSVLICIFFVFSVSWVDFIYRIKSNPLFYPLLGTIFFLIFGYTYSSGTSDDLASHALSYTRLLLIFVLIGSLVDEAWRLKCLYAFCTGCMFLLLSSYVSIFYAAPWDKNPAIGIGADHTVFVNHLWQNVLLSFFACICFVLAKQSNGKQKLIFIAAFVLTVFSIFFLAKGRTGQLTLIASLFVLMIIFYKGVYLALSLIIIPTIFLLSYANSAIMKDAVNLAAQEAQTYISTGKHNNSSVGLRLDNWRTNIKLIQERPLLGHGSGSYRVLTEKIYTDPSACSSNCQHPHNQFLYFWVENGVLCVLFFLWFIIIAFKAGLQSSRDSPRLFLAPLTVVFFVQSMFDSPLVVSMDRAFYVSMFGLFAAGLYAKQAKQA